MNTHFHGHLDEQGLYWFCIDQTDSRVNLLSAALLDAFDEAITQVAQRHPRALIIHSGKPTGFIAGADVREFVAATAVASTEPPLKPPWK